MLFSRLIVSDFLQPRVLQKARLPGPSLTPGVCSKSCPFCWPCHPNISSSDVPSPSVLNLSNTRFFSNESALLIKWPKYWRISFSTSPSNEYSGLIYFRIDWLDLLAFQGTLKSLLQHHISKASALWHSAFFMIQLSHLYLTTGKAYSFWLYTPLWAKWCLCFIICCLGLS